MTHNDHRGGGGGDDVNPRKGYAEIPIFALIWWGDGGRSPHAHHTASETSTTPPRQVARAAAMHPGKSAGTTRWHIIIYYIIVLDIIYSRMLYAK